MKFANLYVDGKKWKNIGDDMMVFSIFNLYRHMGIDPKDVERVPVSALRNYDGEDVLLPINYPFYGLFRLSPRIHPVFLATSVLHAAVIEYMELKKYEPIGCRDIYTYQTLKKAGLDVYLNGCMTITLPRQELGQDRSKAFFIDIPDTLHPFIPSSLLENAVFDTQNYFDEAALAADEIFTCARYKQYINEAKLIVTSRLHCALPCAAAGIPTILASEKKSFRYNWLENILPVYTQERFSEIDWDPPSLEFEDQKKILLDHAASRVWDEYHRLISRPQIYSLYYNENYDYSPESTRNVIAFTEKNWDKNGEYRYILWGVTQTAEFLYDYIQRNYPRARLVGVVDMYHHQIFHGMKTGGLELLKDREIPVFVTVESANEESLKFFKKQNQTKYVICWTNPRTKKVD